jgi:hypothetical protein
MLIFGHGLLRVMIRSTRPLQHGLLRATILAPKLKFQIVNLKSQKVSLMGANLMGLSEVLGTGRTVYLKIVTKEK